VLALAGCGSGAASPNAPDDGVVRVGFLAPCAMRTPDLGRGVEVSRACPADIEHARKLVEGDGVDVVLAYPNDDQGFALALYAETQSDITFVDGSSGLPATTLDVQARNYFRFAPDRRQRAAGLGTYAYRKLGRRHMQLAGGDAYAADAFTVEFCALGGTLGPRQRLPVRARVLYLEASAKLLVALHTVDLEGLRDELARSLDENRQAIVSVEILRGGRRVGYYAFVEQTFGGAFGEDDDVDYRPPCERRDPPRWVR
jgi:hypothetical protein